MSKTQNTATAPLTLAACATGQHYRVVAVQGGHGLRERLEQMGLNQGCVLAKIGKHLFHGPIVVKIKHTELAIGHGMAGRILVEPLP